MDDVDAAFLRERVVEFMGLFTTDFNKPRGCATSILSGMNFIVAECQFRPRGRIVKRKYHKLWGTIIKFIYLPRSESDFAALKLRLGHCRCPKNGNIQFALHETGRKLDNRNQAIKGNMTVLSNDDRVSVFVQVAMHMFQCLQLVMDNADASKTRKGGSDNWPTSLDDLMPFGPDATVKVLHMWANEMDSIIPMQSLGWTLELCKARIIPSLRTANSTASDIVDRLYGCCTRLLDHRNSKRQWTDRCIALRVHTKYIYTLCTSGTSYCPNDFALFINGSEARFIQFFSLLLYTWACPRFHHTEVQDRIMVTAWANIASFFISRVKGSDLSLLGRLHPWLFEKVIEDKSTITEDQNIPYTEPEADQRTLFEKVYRMVSSAKDNTKCDAPGCNNSFELVGRSFQNCGKCRVASFCSNDCQKKSWGYLDAPHKEVCDPLSRVKTYMETSGLQQKTRPGDMTWTLHSEENIEAAGVSEEDLRKILKTFFFSRQSRTDGALTVTQKVGIEGQRRYSDYEEYVNKVPDLDPRKGLPGIGQYINALFESNGLFPGR